MFEQQHVLNKIEYWIDKLPYQTVKVEVVMKNQTLVLEKDKARPVGFQAQNNERGDK